MVLTEGGRGEEIKGGGDAGAFGREIKVAGKYSGVLSFFLSFLNRFFLSPRVHGDGSGCT